jgi:hypothetical protein
MLPDSCDKGSTSRSCVRERPLLTVMCRGTIRLKLLSAVTENGSPTGLPSAGSNRIPQT